MKKSIGLSILLITTGVVFLLDNLGFIDISIREIITTYWPLILIFIGGEKLFRDLK